LSINENFLIKKKSCFFPKFDIPAYLICIPYWIKTKIKKFYFAKSKQIV
jgi:hypothetical protein